MGRRRFSKQERRVIYLAAGGKSELSGEELGADFHADHRIPFSKGGETDLRNAQALTAHENMKKGNSLVDVSKAHEKWQRQFVAKWVAHSSPDFLLAALPGAGKTIASLKAAVKFREQHSNARLVVVVPTKNLVEQWQRKAEPFGWSLQNGQSFIGTLKNTDFNGVAVTYQSVARSAMNFKKFCFDCPTICVLDEVHHAGDENSWGDSIQEAFHPALARLSLSGTPFRSDGKKIPFVSYDKSRFSVPDYRYDYPEACRDGVVRTVSFETFSGEVRYAMDGAITSETMNDSVSEDDAKRLLRSLLNASGDWVKTLLSHAHDRLNDVRKYKHDAGGLALCIDVDHAISVASVLESITGEVPAIVVSDDDAANSSVEQFSKSDSKWIVAVRQVSEGADIPRLMVLCYLTNTATELFFRQAVGRIVRNQNTEVDQNAFCFLPDDPRLIRFASEIDRLQGIALKDDDFDLQAEIERIERDAASESSFALLGTTLVAHEKTIIDGFEYSIAEADEIKNIASDGGIALSAAVKIYEGQKRRGGNGFSPQPPTAVDTEKSKWDIRNELKSLLRKRVGYLSHLMREPHNVVNTIYGEHFKSKYHVSRWPSQDEMTIDQLEEKVQWADEKIAELRATARK